jgi:hypothetical protein
VVLDAPAQTSRLCLHTRLTRCQARL